MRAPKIRPTEEVLVTQLKPHPRNYKTHDQAQLDHIKASLRATGFYRNIVVAKDYTILAGHGVVQAATQMGANKVPVIKLPITKNSPKALKVLTGDNEIGKGSDDDDRLLTELLREIMQEDELLGTGYDEQQLAALLMVTRPASELQDFDAASEWLGMPSYEPAEDLFKLVITCKTEAERAELVAQLEEAVELVVGKKEAKVWMSRWPHEARRDLQSLKFVKGGADE